jgi:hypothetical protein
VTSLRLIDITYRRRDDQLMATSAFPLRFHNPRTRELVKAVAETERISQNELIEQAVEHEIRLRGQLLAEDLASAAAKLAALSVDERAARIVDSINDAAVSEGGAEPFAARALHSEPIGWQDTDKLPARGVMAAFAGGHK